MGGDFKSAQEIRRDFVYILAQCGMWQPSIDLRCFTAVYEVPLTRHVSAKLSNYNTLLFYSGVNIFDQRVNYAIVDFLKRHPYVVLSHSDMNRRWCVNHITDEKMCLTYNTNIDRIPDVYDSVWDQIDCVNVRRVEEIGVRKSVYIDGGISVEQIREMHDVEFLVSNRCITDLSNITIDEVKRIGIVDDVVLYKIIAKYMYGGDKNQFIDDLFEAGFEEWI